MTVPYTNNDHCLIFLYLQSTTQTRLNYRFNFTTITATRTAIALLLPAPIAKQWLRHHHCLHQQLNTRSTHRRIDHITQKYCTTLSYKSPHCHHHDTVTTTCITTHHTAHKQTYNDCGLHAQRHRSHHLDFNPNFGIDRRRAAIARRCCRSLTTIDHTQTQNHRSHTNRERYRWGNGCVLPTQEAALSDCAVSWDCRRHYVLPMLSGFSRASPPSLLRSTSKKADVPWCYQSCMAFCSALIVDMLHWSRERDRERRLKKYLGFGSEMCWMGYVN